MEEVQRLNQKRISLNPITISSKTETLGNITKECVGTFFGKYQGNKKKYISMNNGNKRYALEDLGFETI